MDDIEDAVRETSLHGKIGERNARAWVLVRGGGGGRGGGGRGGGGGGGSGR